MKMPQVESGYFALGGGLDLVTPALTLPPGRVIEAENYEPEINGGYRRINGYERFDGHDSPSELAEYLILPVSIASTPVLGATVTGETSGTTAILLEVDSDGYFVVCRASSEFESDEELSVGGTVVATMTGSETTSTDPEEDAYYLSLATDEYRNDIGPVPGSGAVRGVFELNDVVYALRDSVDGTQGYMYRANEDGWELVDFGYELKFSGGLSEVFPGQTLTNSPGTASALIAKVTVREGDWGSSENPAAGTIFFTAVTNQFISGNQLRVDGSLVATAASNSARITRLPGGTVRLVKYNFGGDINTRYVYGCDGVNKAFEFDGVNYWPISTSMTEDKPSHIAGHKNYLFLSFRGSLQFSSAGEPFRWTPVFGSGEIATGDDITGIKPVAGSSTESALSIFTRNRLQTLYGSSAQDFSLQHTSSDIGFAPDTIQAIGNGVLGLTARGVQSLQTVQQFGNFAYTSLSHLITPFVNERRGTECASTVLQNKSQYRLYFSDGSALVFGFTGDGVSAILPLNYQRQVTCMWTSTWESTKQERTFFGSTDGYVFEDHMGSTFDGVAIESWLRLPFSNFKSPQLRKRYRRAVLEATCDGFSRVNMSYDMGYGNPDIEPPPINFGTVMSRGEGGYWDNFVWDSFNWDTQTVLSPSIALEGTEKNCSLLFYTDRAWDGPHTLQGVTIMYTPRRLER